MLEMIKSYLRALRGEEEGQTLVEYALIVGLVSVAAIGALTLLSGSINGVLGAIQTALDAVVPG